MLVVVFAAECTLFVFDRFKWFPFNHHKVWAVLICCAAVGGAILLFVFWFLASLLLRWWFQFSLRSLLFLPVVVALACGWLATTVGAARKQREAAEWLCAKETNKVGDTDPEWSCWVWLGDDVNGGLWKPGVWFIGEDCERDGRPGRTGCESYCAVPWDVSFLRTLRRWRCGAPMMTT